METASFPVNDKTLLEDSSPQFKKYTKKRSWVWNWIEQDPENKYRVLCIYCLKEIFRLDGDRGSPKKLITHVTSRHGITRSNFNSPEIRQLRIEKVKTFRQNNNGGLTTRTEATSDDPVDGDVSHSPVGASATAEDPGLFLSETKTSSETRTVSSSSRSSRYRAHVSSISSLSTSSVDTGNSNVGETQDMMREISARSSVLLQKLFTEMRLVFKQTNSHKDSLRTEREGCSRAGEQLQTPSLSDYSLAGQVSAVPFQVVLEPEESSTVDPEITEAELKARRELEARRNARIEQYNDIIYAHNIQAEEFNKNIHLHRAQGIKLQHMKYVLTESTINSIQLALAEFISENCTSFKDLLFIESESFRKLVKTIQDNPQQSV